MGTTIRAHEATLLVRFASLDLVKATSLAGRRTSGLISSLALHAVLVGAVLVFPLLYYDWLPVTTGGVARAFFAEPLELAPAPPPPPPRAPARALASRPAPRPRLVDTTKLTAPVEIPDALPVPGASLDLGLGVQGGVPGGVEGGVPGGVVGGIIGGLPPPPPPPPRAHRVVRVGGSIVAPELVRRVDPVYPELARDARIEGYVILEARVDTRDESGTSRCCAGAHYSMTPRSMRSATGATGRCC